MSEVPSYFYRYRSLSGGSAEYVERTVCHSELYFPAPSSFNDPFDCRPCFSFDATSDEMQRYYRGVLQRHLPQLNRAQRRQEAKNKLKDPERDPRNPETLRRVQEMHTEQITEKIGVLCLSTVRDDILMWSHYADSHRGICLEFDGHFPFFAAAHKVEYEEARPRINPFRQTKDQMMTAALLTKSKHWDYEREWRIIHYSEGPGVYRFPEEALTGIILGAHISEETQAKVLGWIEGRSKPVKLYRATADVTAFKVNIS